MTRDPGWELRHELERARAELRAARERIAWMESSRFWKARNAWWSLRELAGGLLGLGTRRPGPPPLPRPEALEAPAGIPGRGARPSPAWRTGANVDVLVLVPDGRARVPEDLDPVIRHTRPPYRLVLVAHGSGEGRDPLRGFSRTQRADLLECEEGVERDAAILRGLAASRAELAAVVEAGAVLGPGWLDRLVACAESDGRIGMVRPLGPGDLAGPAAGPGDADAGLPAGPAGVRLLASIVADGAPPSYPRIEEVDGPCVLVRRGLLDGSGRGPEAGGHGPRSLADLSRRSRLAGWQSAVADDAYVAGPPGNGVWGPAPGGGSRVLEGKRLRVREGLRRRRLREECRARFEGRRVLFVLPVLDRGGGANVVLSEARAMLRMGVDARVLNLAQFREGFLRSYPDVEVPLLFAAPSEIPRAARGFDAVVATAFSSVEWLLPLSRSATPPVLGYYVQDFEPSFFPEGSRDHQRAWDSYTLLPGVRRFAKTEWNAREVETRAGVSCSVVGPSFDADLFRPVEEEPPTETLRVAAMVRPSTPRRQPALTLEVLERAHRRLGGRLEATVFGVSEDDPAYVALKRPFPYGCAGELHDSALVSLLNRTHVFLDASRYQAMGLTAMEAMGCGATAIVPSAGGAGSFAEDGRNAVFVDTSTADAAVDAIERLADSPDLRARLAREARASVVPFHPEAVAGRVLTVLFGDA
ncbi:glycosyltransferase [Acidobacteria bacterium ACD]|nr:glycosyltransferase [Acidobacteria bacterium ACD]